MVSLSLHHKTQSGHATTLKQLLPLIKCFQGQLLSNLQTMVAAPVWIKGQQSQGQQGLPWCRVLEVPQPTTVHSAPPWDTLPSNTPCTTYFDPPPKPRPAATVHDYPLHHQHPGWEELIARTFAPKFQGPLVPPSCHPMEPPIVAFVAPRCLCSLEDPVSMLDQPNLRPMEGYHLKPRTPLESFQRKEPCPLYGKVPVQEGFTLPLPAPSPISCPARFLCPNPSTVPHRSCLPPLPPH